MANYSDMEFQQFSQVASNRQKISFPAMVFNRTPNRQRATTMAEPPRAQTPIQSSKRLWQEAMSPQGNLVRSKAFEKNSLRNSLNTNKQNRDSMNFGSDGLRCHNHTNKGATFEIVGVGQERLTYCEKCAILLASQGFKVNRLARTHHGNDHHERIQRAEEVRDILQLADETHSVLSTRKEQLSQALHKSEATLTDELNRMHGYFDFVSQLVEKLRAQTQAQVIEDYRQSHSISQQFAEIVEDSLFETDKLKNELNETKAKLVEMPHEKYSPAVELCKLKLTSYKRCVKDYPLEELQPPHLDYKLAEQLEEAVGQALVLTNRPCTNNMLTSSKKLQGRSASIYFSFDADKSSDVIPEENQASQEEC